VGTWRESNIVGSVFVLHVSQRVSKMILNSWKEIAKHLRCGVRTAQRWEQELGLPIRRPGGLEKHVVLAMTEELDEWVSFGGTNVTCENVRDSLSRTAELREELARLRIRQRELVTELRAGSKSSKLVRGTVSESTSIPVLTRRQGASLMTLDDRPGTMTRLNSRHDETRGRRDETGRKGLVVAC
jgi:hypothetical protein